LPRELQTVEITAGKKDPAYEIMEQVIAHKKENMREASSWIRETYLKIVLERDTSQRKPDKKAEADSLKRDSLPPPQIHPALMIESQASAHYQAPGDYRTLIHAYRENSFEKTNSLIGGDAEDREYEADTENPYIFYPDPALSQFNFYQNLILIQRLGDRPLISPLHSELWRVTYRYHLEERRYEEGKVVYKISFTPRNEEGACFSGVIYVVDGLFAIEAAEMEVQPATLSFFRRFTLKNIYQRNEDGRWVLAEESYEYEVKDGRDILLGHTQALHTDYQLDVAHPKGFFGNEIRSFDRSAFETGEEKWQAIRPIKLDSTETKFLQVQDSLKKFYRSPEYLHQQDSVYNHLSLLDIAFNGIAFRDRVRGMKYYFYPIVEQIRPLGVGGYRHALGGNIEKTFGRGKAVDIFGEANYGITNNDMRGNLGLGFTYAPRRFARGYVKAGDEYSMVNGNDALITVFSRRNFINKVFVGVGHSMEIANGLNLGFGIDFADRKAIDKLELEEWSKELFGENNTPIAFDTYREFLVEVRLRYTPGQKFQMMPYRKIILGSKWPTFTLRYKKALPGIWGSDLNFDFISLRIEHEFRLGTMGIARWNVTAGTFIQANNIRFTDYVFFRGSDPWIFVDPSTTFQLLGRTLSTPNEYVAGHYVHDFGTLLFNKIPLIQRSKLMCSAGAGVLMVRDNAFIHSEVYAGLQYPFRIRRERFKAGVFFVTSYGNHAGAVNSAVKFGVSFYNTVKNRWEY
jgi:Family of unknown function (DUF5686)